MASRLFYLRQTQMLTDSFKMLWRHNYIEIYFTLKYDLLLSIMFSSASPNVVKDL